jgi:inosine-uridine nucleoside N-ribohydrolase
MPDSMFLHDPTALAAVVAPHLFTWLEGPVVVCVGKEESNNSSIDENAPSSSSPTSGLGGFSNPLRGMTVIDQGEKRWAAQKNSTANAWVGRPPARVATGCDSKGVVRLVLERLTDAAVAGGG